MTSSNAWASPALQRTPGPAGEFLRICSGRVNPGSALGIAGHASSPGELLDAAESEMNRAKPARERGFLTTPCTVFAGLSSPSLGGSPCNPPQPTLQSQGCGTQPGGFEQRGEPLGGFVGTVIPCVWNDRGLARAPA